GQDCTSTEASALSRSMPSSSQSVHQNGPQPSSASCCGVRYWPSAWFWPANGPEPPSLKGPPSSPGCWCRPTRLSVVTEGMKPLFRAELKAEELAASRPDAPCASVLASGAGPS